MQAGDTRIQACAVLKAVARLSLCQRNRGRFMRRPVQMVFTIFALLYILPVAVSTAWYFVAGRHDDWRSADRSTTGLLLPAREMPDAVVRIFSARTVSWRSIIATHSWVVIKEEN